MRPTRRDRRVLAAIENELQCDERLLEVFEGSVWPDQRCVQVNTLWVRRLVLEPPSHVGACLTCIALQLSAVAGCALGASTRQTLVIIIVMVLYPFAFTPLVKWSEQHPPPESTP